MLADRVVADHVLARIERLSSKYGTRIDRREGLGVVEI